MDFGPMMALDHGAALVLIPVQIDRVDYWERLQLSQREWEESMNTFLEAGKLGEKFPPNFIERVCYSSELLSADRSS